MADSPNQALVYPTYPVTWRTMSPLAKKEMPQVIRVQNKILGSTQAAATPIMNAQYSSLTISRIIGIYVSETTGQTTGAGQLGLVELETGWTAIISKATGAGFGPVYINIETLPDSINFVAWCTRSSCSFNFSLYNFEVQPVISP